jgi:hypothetical protein
MLSITLNFNHNYIQNMFNRHKLVDVFIMDLWLMIKNMDMVNYILLMEVFIKEISIKI